MFFYEGGTFPKPHPSQFLREGIILGSGGMGDEKEGVDGYRFNIVKKRSGTMERKTMGRKTMERKTMGRKTM